MAIDPRTTDMDALMDAIRAMPHVTDVTYTDAGGPHARLYVECVPDVTTDAGAALTESGASLLADVTALVGAEHYADCGPITYCGSVGGPIGGEYVTYAVRYSPDYGSPDCDDAEDDDILGRMWGTTPTECDPA